jgi:pimeloyl-ACP methyl ester carboxylesterase
MPIDTINGVKLYWELSGPAGDPVVLVHGSWGDHHNWAPVVPALAQSFRVLTYDRRGHSHSERPDGQGSVLEDVDDLAALIEHLDLAPAHIVGNSFGAAIVLRLAARRPELFRSLVVHEPPLFGLLSDEADTQAALAAVQARIAAVVALLSAGRHADGARQFVENVAFGPGTWTTLPQPVRDTFVTNAPTWLDETRDPDALTMDTTALNGFSAPALLTVGDQSPPYFAPVMERLAATLPHAQRWTYTGAGHVPHLSHPQDYLQRVTAFLRD